MRFKARIHNIRTFEKLAASLNSLGPFAWVKLSEEHACFTIIPEQGTQVWASLAIVRPLHVLCTSLSSQDSIFHVHAIQSLAENTINLEVPLAPLTRALRSALRASSIELRLTKKDDMALLALTMQTTSSPPPSLGAFPTSTRQSDDTDVAFGDGPRETVVTQEIPVKTIRADQVAGLHQPHCRDPDVHIMLPPLQQLKSISDRFTRLALCSSSGAGAAASNASTRLELAANMHGCLRVRVATDALHISSVWTGLNNPELDPEHLAGGERAVRDHPSTRMKAVGRSDGRGEAGWAAVRIDARDWGKVLSVGRLSGKVIACLCHDHALILYVYLPDEDAGGTESCLTYYISSYSA